MVISLSNNDVKSVDSNLKKGVQFCINLKHIKMPIIKLSTIPIRYKSVDLLAFQQTEVQSLLRKCPYVEFFWSAFLPIWTEYGEILRISPDSNQIWENTDQKNSNTDTFYAVNWFLMRVQDIETSDLRKQRTYG